MITKSLYIAVATLYLLLPSCVTQRVGEQCERVDDTFGTCMDLGRCLQSEGNVQSVKNLKSCSNPGGDVRQTPVCCRSNSRKIARTMCSKWNENARNLGIGCGETTTRIHGGNFAQVNEFPHMVAVVDRNDNRKAFCGGTLISESFVITAAHCIEDLRYLTSQIFVRVGAINLKEEDSQLIEVQRIIRHPLYDPPYSYHDIALLELRTEVQFSRSVLPACLPTLNGRLETGRILNVAGWGATERTDFSNVLLKGFAKTISRFKCDDSLSSGGLQRQIYVAGITDSIICVDESSSGACKGDSGGPLSGEDVSTCQHIIFGVVSKGSPSCQGTVVPGIYTNVEHYIHWIVSHVWPRVNV
ncbi:cathepsin G-like [Penaeus japonicus]|uniref:cathepsin G-like n=1 Tax=Penaeus japonicus TaxID=27405 RepID=UPI001C70DF0E|nr:cathepsin G-like [Penaeus japonicus]